MRFSTLAWPWCPSQGAWYVSLRILLASFGVIGPVILIVWTSAVFAIVVRDVIHRRWSPVSVGALPVFLLFICIVIAAEFQWAISSSGQA